MDRTQEPQIAAGTVFQGRYEVLSKLGEGGYGQVYRARQRATNQEVAVKVLRAPQAESAHQVARFQREMQLCSQLYHPNIVRLIDSGQSEESVLFTVFEYVPGRTLAEVLTDDGALPPWEAAHLMLQVLDALGCAHNQGVVHRDLKPQNIMVTHTGVRRNALVLDFGLGTLVGGPKAEELARLTRTREVLGTPAYAAPEQLRGEPATAASDLYAWGLIFLECLTGRRVIDGGTLQEVLYKQLGPEPIRVPSWLEGHRLGWLLRRVTSKDVDARSIRAQEALRELEACSSEGWPDSEASVGAAPAVAARLPTPNTPERAPEGERRQLTALCVSLSLTPESDAVDPEELDGLLRAQHAACADVARRFDAYVGSILGERMLLYFGYPQAREDDARRAARAALAIVEELEQRGARLANEQRVSVEVRAGLHTGLVSRQEARGRHQAELPALLGATPNVASRLEAQAEAGAVWVSEATSRLLREGFVLEPVGAVRAGAGVKPGPVFRLRGELRAPAAMSAASGARPSVLHGRSQELELLQQRWQQATRGSGQAILLAGEAGIGKSRLALELARRTGEVPHTFLECRCAPEGRLSTLRPVVELLERLVGFQRDWTPERLETALEDMLGRYGFELTEVMPLFAVLFSVKGGSGRYPPLDVSPQRQKDLTLEAILALLSAMAEQQPVLFLVEDLHWADPTTLELLGKLVEDAASLRLCALLTARPEFAVPWPPAKVLQVQLGRLDRQRAEEMVAELTRDTPLPREVMEQVVGRTDGVPLFVEELTRMVVEGLSGAKESSASPRPTIPATLRDSLMARLDRLGPAKETAQLAAALGREFSHDVLRAVSARDEAALKRDLDALVSADLVHRRRGVRGTTFSFKHALIRDTALESLLKPARRQVHARIAATLELRFPDVVQSRPDLLAHHHAQADQKREALEYARKAGLAALIRSANAEAIAHATEALAWLDVLADERERAQVELSLNGIITPALMGSRGWSDAAIKAQVDRSRALIDLLGDGPHAVPTLWALLTFHHTRGQRAEARALAERLVSMEGVAQDVDHQVATLPALGHAAWIDGRMGDSRAAFERALSLYEPARHAQQAHVYGLDSRSYAGMGLGEVLCLMGLPDQGLAQAKAAVDWALELNHASTLGLAYIYLLMVHQQRGERERVVEVADAALAMTQRQGMPVHGAYAQIVRGWATQEPDVLVGPLGFQDALGFELGMTYYASLLVELHAARGQHAEALARVEDLLRRGRTLGETYYVPELLRLKALSVLATTQDTSAAEALLREAVTLARQDGTRLLELRATLALGRLLRDMRRPAEAVSALRPVLDVFTEGSALADVTAARELLVALDSPRS
ncbi:TOMM system kinase/cyclase fusion protein [Corallococcus sp. H22C18031201]|nr:TOMM system kinase/cyclase fusion protein [Corallococcus sp. H22C18031201]